MAPQAIATGRHQLLTSPPPANNSYDYNAAANPANIQGNWLGSSLSGAATSIAVSSNGTMTGTSGGCSFTGTVTPRTSGKNVFDASMTFGALPCALPNQTATGMALAYATTNNQTQLLIGAVDSARTTGTMFFAHR